MKLSCYAKRMLAQHDGLIVPPLFWQLTAQMLDMLVQSLAGVV
jgi:hypothetical protein